MKNMIEESALNRIFIVLTEAYLDKDYETFNLARDIFESLLKIRDDNENTIEKDYNAKMEKHKEEILALKKSYDEEMAGKDKLDQGSLAEEKKKIVPYENMKGQYRIICELIGKYNLLPTGGKQ